MTEVMAGRIGFFFGPVGLVLPLIRDGRLRALDAQRRLAIGRTPGNADPQEAGFVDAEYPISIGLSCRRHVAQRHRKAAWRNGAALQSAKVNSKLLALGVDPMAITTSEYDAYVRKEIALNAKLQGHRAQGRVTDRYRSAKGGAV